MFAASLYLCIIILSINIYALFLTIIFAGSAGFADRPAYCTPDMRNITKGAGNFEIFKTGKDP